MKEKTKVYFIGIVWNMSLILTCYNNISFLQNALFLDVPKFSLYFLNPSIFLVLFQLDCMEKKNDTVYKFIDYSTVLRSLVVLLVLLCQRLVLWVQLWLLKRVLQWMTFSSMVTGQASNFLNSFIGFRSLPIVILLIVL